jgi:hypothetical protein
MGVSPVFLSKVQQEKQMHLWQGLTIIKSFFIPKGGKCAIEKQKLVL